MFADFDPLDLKPGQMVSHWRIVRRIGRGGYAVVYEVEKDGERFALKVACQTERSLDPKQTDARARREAACLQLLNHRHIIRMRGQGRWPGALSGFHYIVHDEVTVHGVRSTAPLHLVLGGQASAIGRTRFGRRELKLVFPECVWHLTS
jgi:serine/threonine protein kinase